MNRIFYVGYYCNLAGEKFYTLLTQGICKDTAGCSEILDWNKCLEKSNELPNNRKVMDRFGFKSWTKKSAGSYSSSRETPGCFWDLRRNNREYYVRINMAKSKKHCSDDFVCVCECVAAGIFLFLFLKEIFYFFQKRESCQLSLSIPLALYSRIFIFFS